MGVCFQFFLHGLKGVFGEVLMKIYLEKEKCLVYGYDFAKF